MFQILPILLTIVGGFAMYRLSAWRLARELDAKSTELLDPSLTPFFDQLALALDLTRVPVYLYEIEPINGLAAPDGRVFLTRGFYKRYRSGEITGQELASVVAHELGHVALGHSRQRMIDFSGQNALRTVLAIGLSRVIPGVGPMIANAVVSLLQAKLSRRDEFEADAYAAALLSKAGIGIAPQVSMFSKLDALTGQINGTPAWLLSHPSTSDRIDAITKMDKKWRSKRF
ncbi:MAG: M48 family metallopeptidase [Pseudoprimorskyibacter sp.]|nr:M48 family metallopeptidase [Pseudoprimorskyibacter sp.]